MTKFFGKKIQKKCIFCLFYSLFAHFCLFFAPFSAFWGETSASRLSYPCPV